MDGKNKKDTQGVLLVGYTSGNFAFGEYFCSHGDFVSELPTPLLTNANPCVCFANTVLTFGMVTHPGICSALQGFRHGSGGAMFRPRFTHC